VSTPTIEQATAAYRAKVLEATREFLSACHEAAGLTVPPFEDPGQNYDAADIALDALELSAAIAYHQDLG